MEEIYLREMSFSISPSPLKYSQFEKDWELTFFHMDSLDDKIFLEEKIYLREIMKLKWIHIDSSADKIYFLKRKYI